MLCVIICKTLPRHLIISLLIDTIIIIINNNVTYRFACGIIDGISVRSYNKQQQKLHNFYYFNYELSLNNS